MSFLSVIGCYHPCYLTAKYSSTVSEEEYCKKKTKDFFKTAEIILKQL